DPEVTLDSFGKITVEQAQHNTQMLAHRTALQGGFKIGDVIACHGDQSAASTEIRGTQGVLPAGVTEHDRRTDLACERHARSVLVAVHADHGNAEVIEL